MKTRLIFIVLIFLLPAGSVLAKGPGTPAGPGGPGSGRMNGPVLYAASSGPIPGSGLSSLENILQMDDDQLAELEALVKRIRQMSTEERQAYLDKIRQYQEMAPEQRQNLQMAWGRIDERVRRAWRDYMLSLDMDQRQSIHQEMQEVPFEERNSWRINRLVEAGLITPEEAGLELNQ